MPEQLQLSQIIPFAGIAAQIVFAFTNKPHHVMNPQTMYPEIHVLPWVLQINYGLAYMLYGQTQGDVFLFVNSIPVNYHEWLSHSLHWHPFYNKRIRSLHEYMLFFMLLITLITNAATAVYFKDRNSTVQQIGSGVPVVTWAVVTALSLTIEKWRLLSTSRPKALEIMSCGAIFFAGAGDWTVCTTGIVWLTFSVLHGCMIVYGMFYNGGVEMGWETEEDEDVDLVVERFNREPTIEGYPPLAPHNAGYMDGPGSSSSSRMSMGRTAGEMEQYSSEYMYSQGHRNGGGDQRSSRRSVRGEKYAPEFMVNEH
ncbi:hypothetical protein BCR33DRAFT_719003 [Rhizoclosmatium globosum]|uniref:Uncharacterized protein n=1 Tax=Rhizoclosmatium globosum TaxID=329046 RepID=A0A1Y2C2Z0_9FUNG|nr:hypothetical protein BCR33DRAFT_719003 [Rhizoclosmatium globosum]|eukprot:ORY41400.1 hypothetical protein BCR33DRAFT_719003 [Rhizoclosmatium globosum]